MVILVVFRSRSSSPPGLPTIGVEKPGGFNRIYRKEDPMKLKDKAAWELSVKRNQDPYGKATMDYAKRWAELMEKEFSF